LPVIVITLAKPRTLRDRYRNMAKDGAKVYESIRLLDDEETIQQRFPREIQKKDTRARFGEWWRNFSIQRAIVEHVPFLQWFKEYKLSYLKADVLTGLTLAAMVIPQGMAYGLLAKLPAIYGLYCAVVPTLVYAFVGTSTHASVGPLAAVSLMVGNSAESLVSWHRLTTQGLGMEGCSEDPLCQTLMVDTAVAMAFLIGLLTLLMHFLQLGFVITLMSDPVLRGYTCGVAFLIVTGQLKHIFSLDVKGSGFVTTISQLVPQLPQTNVVTLMIAVGTCCVLVACKFLNAKYKPTIPLPSQLIALVIFTCVSYFGDLAVYADLNVLGEVPPGLPFPRLPRFTITLAALLPVCGVISIISFVLHISICQTLATKNSYIVRPNQELFATGLAWLLGAVFQSHSVCTSMSRSYLVDNLAPKSPLHGLVSAVIVIIVLLLLTPLLTSLPFACLATIICVALSKALAKVTFLKSLLKVSKPAAANWVVSFLATLLGGTTLGVVIGVGFSWVLALQAIARPNVAVLGRLPNTSLFRNILRFKDATPVPEVLVFRFDAPLIFVNQQYFRDSILEAIESSSSPLYAVVIDLSVVGDMDFSGLIALEGFVKDVQNTPLDVVMAGGRTKVKDLLEKSEMLQLDQLFPSVDSAVLHVTRECGVVSVKSRSMEAGDAVSSDIQNSKSATRRNTLEGGEEKAPEIE
jgi:high affinity sulfate transporter 1